MPHKYPNLGDTVYFEFGSNDTSGSGDDGATPAAHVRLAGAAAAAAPVLSPTPTLLSNVAYPAGCYEVAVAATAGNGFAAGSEYAVFCTLAVDGENPTGFVGSFLLVPAGWNALTSGLTTAGSIGKYILDYLKGAGASLGTITVQDADSAAIADVSVWLTSDAAGNTVVAGSQETASDGTAGFLVDVGSTYYIWAQKDAYNDVQATVWLVTAALAKTITMTAASATAADLSQGFLARGIRQVRRALDEPAVNAKWTDSDIIEILETNYGQILDEINRNSPFPVGCRYDLTLGSSADEQHFQLPSIIGSVRAAEIRSSADEHEGFLAQTDITNLGGQPWRLDNNTLWIAKDAFSTGYTLRLLLIPNGSARMNAGTLGTVAADGSTVTLPAAPTTGSLDVRPQAYLGSVLRILGATTNYVMQERTASDYDAETRILTIKPVLDPIPTGTVLYEIGPAVPTNMQQAMVVAAAIEIAAYEGLVERVKALQLVNTKQLRALRLWAAHRDSYLGVVYAGDTAWTGQVS